MSLFTPVNMKTDYEIAWERLLRERPDIQIAAQKSMNAEVGLWKARAAGPEAELPSWAEECRQMREAIRVARGEPYPQSMEAAQKNTIWLTHK